MEHLLSNGQRVNIPNHETFYRLLTRSNAGLIPPEEQQLLRQSRILISGCGSVGAYVAEGLVREGAEHLVLVDPLGCSYNHLSRMAFDLRALEQNRAEAMSDRLHDINPYAETKTVQQGLTPENVSALVSDADMIVDAIGVQTVLDLQTRLMLHTAAKRHQVPVITGFDVAYSGWVLVYDYRDENQSILDGGLTAEAIENSDELDRIQIITGMISLSHAPIEMVRETERLIAGQTTRLPRLAQASQLSSVIICRAVVELLAGHPVRKAISVDLAAETRPPATGLRMRGKRMLELFNLRRHIRSRRRTGRIGVFSPLDDEVFLELRPYMEERTYEAGSVIIRQGEAATEFFVILEGAVHVEYEQREEEAESSNYMEPADEYTVIAELGPGDYFGEIGLLTETTRAASVVAAERCRVLTLSRGAFELYMEESGPAASRVRELALSRQRSNERMFDV